MITPAQRRAIEAHAYVPEHLPRYVEAITAARPHLFGDYLAYAAGDRLIFVGYPLYNPYAETAFLAALDAAIARLRPRLIAVTAPALPPALACHPATPPDAYYRLDLADVRPDKKLRNLLRRAGRELTVQDGARFGPEHERLVAAFLAETPVDAGTRFIFERVGRYAGTKGGIRSGIEALAGLVANGTGWLMSSFRGEKGLEASAGQPRHESDRLKPRVQRETSPPHPPPGEPTSPPHPPLLRGEGGDASPLPSQGGGWGVGPPGAPLILEARDAAGRLVAFDVVTFGGEYAFYLFNFRARDCYVPGASDLLLARLIGLAQEAGKRYLNLGLGINPGVRGFKEKWGAVPFLPHVACTWERPRAAWEEMLAGV